MHTVISSSKPVGPADVELLARQQPAKSFPVSTGCVEVSLQALHALSEKREFLVHYTLRQQAYLCAVLPLVEFSSLEKQYPDQRCKSK